MSEYIKKHLGFITVILLGLIPLYPLFFPGLPITHDGQDHVARIANFYQSLSEGNIVPRWAANLNWSYGHPILMFLYPFPSYIAAFVHFLGFNLVDSLKIVFGLSFILSGVFMYLWIRNIFGEKSGVIAGVLYMLAPYRFIDLYVRGAIGEHVAFVFLPLVFYFMHKISINPKKSSMNIGLAFSFAALLLSHNAISLMFIPLILIYGGILIFYSKHKRTLFLNLSIFGLLGFGISAFFVFPAFLEGKYTLRDIVTGGGEYKDRFISLTSLLSPVWSFGGSDALSKQIGYVQIVGVILSFFVVNKLKKDNKLLLTALLIMLFLSIFIMFPISDFIWKHVSILQKFQFPWRFLSIVVFTSAVASSASVLLFKNKKIAMYYVIAVCMAALLIYFPYYKVQGYLHKPESFYSGIYDSTTDTGESAPIWSVRFMEKRPKQSVEFITGTGEISTKKKNTTERIYVIRVASDFARIRESILYFPNWSVYVNGVKVNIEFQDQLNRGLITYNLKKGTNNVLVKFEDTKVRQISNIVSLMSLVFLLLYLAITRFIKK